MKRVHWHWTAGSPGLIDLEADSYHEIIQSSGKVQPGQFSVEANRAPLRPGKYAAHTLNANTDAIGIACDAMAGARERPFSWGSNPLAEEQIESMLQRTADYCEAYDIEVSRETTLSHAEVEPNLGIRQKAKWDFTVLPGMDRLDDPVVVGDELRRRLTEILKSRSAVQSPPKPEGSVRGGPSAAVAALVAVVLIAAAAIFT